ncbi:MAG: hypothetical protein ACTHOF_04475 [Flavisolibacter sp.]
MPLNSSSNIDSVPGNKEKVSLNEVMQQSLQRFQLGRSSDVIIRCENLPDVEIDKDDIAKVFNDILNMIINFPPTGSKLFLHVDCEEERVENNDPALAKKVFNLYFHTNCRADEKWKLDHRETIEKCAALLAHYNAGFTVNEIKAAGCLFSISLLGKT